MFSTRLLAQRLVQQIKVYSRQQRILFSSNWRASLGRRPSLVATSVAITITGTFLYIKKTYLGFNEIHCGSSHSRIQPYPEDTQGAHQLHSRSFHSGSQKLEGKTVLITGAAGDLGSTTARAFSEQGAQIVLCDLAGTEPKLKQLTTELLSLGSPAVMYISVDVSNVEDVKRCVEKAVKEFKNVDILFNNAGICCEVEPVQSVDEEAFKRTQDVNVYGVFLMMKHVSIKMIESGKGGVIVNASSIAGLKGGQFSFSYMASKFAVTGMTKAAAKSLAKHNIRVNAIAPFFIEGHMADRIIKDITEKGSKIKIPSLYELFVSYSVWFCDKGEL